MDKTTNVKWNYISEVGLPQVVGEKAKAFLVCRHVELGEVVTLGSLREVIPTGVFKNAVTIALIQNHESESGFAYTPANKFFYGPDIYNDVYAWAEFPEAAPYVETD